METRTEIKTCIICGRKFEAWKRGLRKGKRSGSYRQPNARTCSKECSKEYSKLKKYKRK